MSRKSGITLVMLIIYIVISLVIISAVVLNLTNNQEIDDINKYTFLGTINDYKEQYETMKNFYTVKGNFDAESITIKGDEVDGYGRTISDYIASLTLRDKAFICIDHGRFGFYNLDENDARRSYMEDIDIEMFTY